MEQPETKDTKGSLILRTVAMPADTNPNGDQGYALCMKTNAHERLA